MINQFIKTEKTARISLSSALNEQVSEVLIVCHGYGHLSPYFIKKFEFLANEHFVIVAPEGLHRYYLNGLQGRVGASWMTKEERDYDIRDYCHYLDLVYDMIYSQCSPNVKIHILGFSQGGATVSRWIAHTEKKIEHVVLWASVFPPDMNWVLGKESFLSKQLTIVSGRADEFLSEEKVEQQLNALNDLGIDFQFYTFDGGHEIDQPTLQSIFKTIQ